MGDARVRVSEMNDEVKAFNKGSKEGLRAVALYWCFFAVFLPALLFSTLIVLTAYNSNGPVAGLLSALIFGSVMFVFSKFMWKQLKKSTGYLRK